MNEELRLAQYAAREAGKIILSYFKRTYQVHEKGIDDPVTTADLKANEKIRDILAQEFPDDGWLSEETKDSSQRLEATRVWVVDPLDGTKDFIQGNPEFTVCISLVENHKPVVGVVYNPITNDLYYASKNSGAFWNGRPIRCSPLRDLKQATLMVSNTEYRQGKIDPFKEAVAALKTAGSTAFRIALVAKGQADLYLSVEDKNEWDICAADILIHEASGLLTDLSGQERWYNQINPHIPEGIIAGNEFLIKEMLKLL